MGFITRAWRGQESPVKVFLLYGYVFQLVAGSALGALGSLHANYIAIILILPPYFVWWSVAAWRCSAGIKYPFVARIIVIINVLGFPIFLVGDLSQAYLVNTFNRDRVAAEQGNTGAQNDLGIDYHNGYGVEQNDVEALKWWKKASDSGYGFSELNLGLLYLDGAGVSKDYAEASKWFLKAAEQGVSEAQFNIGECYRNGFGVPVDLVQADMWYIIALYSKNDKTRIAYRAELENSMTPEQIASAKHLAEEWKQHHPNLNSAPAQKQAP